MSLEAYGGWPGVLTHLLEGKDLDEQQARAVLGIILEGEASEPQIAAFLIAMRMKGETAEEISGLVEAMLDVAEPLDVSDRDSLIDTCGTGGDRSRSINVSTAAAFVLAGAGGKVCKHGNRAVSSSTGSADVLETLGVPVELGPSDVARMINETGFGFCFAQRFHSATRFVAPVRKALGVPTVFNFLGPLANPARLRRQIIGVGNPAMAGTIVDVAVRRKSLRTMVVYGNDGLDELTTTTSSVVFECREGEVERFEIDAADFGLARARTEDLVGGDADVNARAIRDVLSGKPGAHRDIVVLNAAAGLLVGDLATGWEQAVALAQESIDSGKASAVLDAVSTN